MKQGACAAPGGGTLDPDSASDTNQVPRLTAPSTPLRLRSSFWGRKFAGPKTSERGDGSNPGTPRTPESVHNPKRRHRKPITLRGVAFSGQAREPWRDRPPAPERR